MAQVVVRDVVSVPPWYTTANSAASLSSGSLFPAFLKEISCHYSALTQALFHSNDMMYFDSIVRVQHMCWACEAAGLPRARLSLGLSA